MLVAWDTETALIQRGVKAPPLACVSYATHDTSGVYDSRGGLDQLDAWLSDPSIELVGHNVAYDAAVVGAARPALVPKLFEAYAAGRITDTMVNEQLFDLAEGKLGYRPRGWYTLNRLAKDYAQIDMDKDTWRLQYGKLMQRPMSEWPDGALEYSRLDAVATLVARHQQRDMPDLQQQTRVAFALQLAATWGMRTDAESVERLEAELVRGRDLLGAQLVKHGLLRANGSQDTRATKRMVEAAWPRELGPLPATPKYQQNEDDWDALPIEGVSCTSDVVLRCKDARLSTLVEFKKLSKVLTTYVPALRDGIDAPVCTNFNVLQANGRTSSFKPNIQNPPREGGVRECFVPRPGHVFISVDYDTLENRTLAQALKYITGSSSLAQWYRKDPDFDVHSAFASKVMGISYADALARKKAKDKDFAARRQEMKQVVYGVPGGMGAETLRGFAFKGSGGKVDLSLDRAKQLKQEFLDFIPEMRPYFDWCGMQTAHDQRARVTQFVSGRVRGGCFYTDLANGMWSALANDGAKAALFEISKRCYTYPNSWLYGCRVVLFLHDEFVIEAPEEIAHEAGHEMAEIAVAVMESYTPDVPHRASPAAMRRWYKGADTVYDRHGRLVPWEPKGKP